MCAVVPVGRPVPAARQLRGVHRPAIEVGDLDRLRGVGPVEHRHSALIPGLHHDVAPRDRDQRAVVGHAGLLRGLRRRHLVVALELQLAIRDGEDGVGTPLLLVRGPALGLRAPAPLVGEEQLGPVVVERGRVPVGEVGVGDLVNAYRARRVADVEQQTVALAGTTREAHRRVDGDVVALGGTRGAVRLLAHHHGHELGQRVPEHRAVRRRRRATPAAGPDDVAEDDVRILIVQDLLLVTHGVGECATRLRVGDFLRSGDAVLRRVAVRGGRHQVVEDPRRAHDRRLLRVGDRYLDHLDAEPRRVRIQVRHRGGAARQLAGRAHHAGSRDVDVDVGRVPGVHQQRVGVGATAGLHVADVLRVVDVADVEDPEPAQPVLAHGVTHALGAAVQPRRQVLAGDEEQVLVDRDVALAGGADVPGDQLRLARLLDVPHLEAVVVALDEILAGEGHVRVGDPGELLGRRVLGDHLQVPHRLARIVQAGLEADPRIGAGRLRRLRARGRRCAVARRGRAGAAEQEGDGGRREKRQGSHACHAMSSNGVQEAGSPAGNASSMRSIRAISVV